MRRSAGWLLLTLLALGLRLYGITWGLPTETESLRSYHPDEAPFMSSISYVRNPFRFAHFNLVMGTWHLYTTGAAVAAGAAAGWFTLTGDRAYYAAHLADLDRMYLCGRLVSAAMGAASVPLIYAVGCLWYSRAAGLAAAALLAVTPLLVVDSHYFYTGIAVTFWALLALWFIARLQTSPMVRKRDLLGAGVFTSLAVFVQYNAALLVPLIPLALWLRPARPAWRELKAWLLWTLVALVAGSIIACPNAWFDPGGFLEHFGPYFVKHFGGEHKTQTNFQGSAAAFYLWTAPLEGCGPVIYAALWPALLAALWRRRNADLVLLAFLALNLLLLMTNSWYMTHYIALALPAVLLLLGALLELPRRFSGALRLAGVVLVLAGLLHSLAYARLLAAPDVRTQASRWLEANVPAGATVGVHAIYFYSLPALQRISGSPYDVREYNFDADRLQREMPEYFVICDYEYGLGSRLLQPDYPPEPQAWRLFAFVQQSGAYRLVHEAATAATLFGITFSPEPATWHWRYPNPRVWIYRRTAPG